MAERTFTTNQKLAVVEKLIEDFRYAKSEPHTDEGRTYLALKAVADDIRAHLPETPDTTKDRLQELIDIAQMAKVDGQYRLGHLQAIAEFTIGAWPALRVALALLKERVS